MTSLRDAGEPVPMRESGSWALRRPIPSGGGLVDAAGCYPLLSCHKWEALDDDLRALNDVVSFTAVADPFGNHDLALLERTFPDVCRPYKEHFVVDLTESGSTARTSHHRRNVARAARLVEVDRCEQPRDHGDEWVRLYAELVGRHQIRSTADFSERALREQLSVPGVVALRALTGDRTVGMTIWYVQDDVAYYHLGAYDEMGYQTGASFALFDRAVTLLREQAGWADLGGGAGVSDATAGLIRFKRGWATGIRMAHLCGRVLQPEAYRNLSAGRQRADGFFPAYREEVQ